MAKTAIEKEIAELIGEARSKAVVELLTKPRDMATAPTDGSQVIIIFKRATDERLVRTTARYREAELCWCVGSDSLGHVIRLNAMRIVGWNPLLPHPSNAE